MKKHVYLFNEGSRAAVYGIGTYIRQMITCLVALPDIELHVIQIGTDVAYFERKTEAEYDTCYCPVASIRVSDKGDRYYRNICYLLRLNICPKEQEETVFLFNYTSQAPLIKRIRECYPDSRIYFTIHYQDWCFSLDGDVSRFKEIIHKKDETLPPTDQRVYDSYLKERELLQCVDQVICLSKFTRHLLEEVYGVPSEKSLLIYNGLKDERRPLSSKERNALKRRFHISPKEKIILFVGRLDSIKGIKTLIAAFQDLVQQNPAYRLIVVGDGDYNSCLGECKENWNKVTFTGRLGKEQLYDFYQIADVGVMPSMHEQCSYVGIEMMMFGLPMVISTTTGLKEMMENEDFGYTFTMKSEDEAVRKELTGLILQVLTALPEQQARMRELSRFYYEKRYSEREMRRGYEELLIS